MNFTLLSALLLAFAIPADWTTPLAPFRISGNLYYVGSRDLASYLVATPAGNILINANLESSPAQIRQSVETLGFRWKDTKILLSSQAHYDHVAGAAEVIRTTHARHMVMDGDVDVVRSGGATDFDKTLARFPPAPVDRILHDNDVVTLGGVAITAHKTAGHTKGCTTWTMQTREGGKTLNVVIVGGWAANPGAYYPEQAADFAHTFEVLKALPCDIFLGAHGIYFDLLGKLERKAGWVDPEGYRKAVLEKEAVVGLKR